MKIVVVSDTHGHKDRLAKVINLSAPFDMLIHCGDGVRDIGSVKIPENTIVATVMGNTDIYSYGDSEELIIENILGTRVAITHGHRFNVKAGTSYLVAEAGKLNASVVVFGHTHTRIVSHGNPVLFNPGALSEKSYGIIEASKDTPWVYEHRSLPL